MATSMVSTVLEIENEARKILAEAEREADNILVGAETQRKEAGKAAEEGVRRVIADLEAKATEEKARKARELTAAGDVALSAVRNISPASYAGGVQYIMKALGEK